MRIAVRSLGLRMSFVMVRYRIVRRGDWWFLSSDESGHSVFCAHDRDELISLAESTVKDVGGELTIDSPDDGAEAVLRHSGRRGPADRTRC